MSSLAGRRLDKYQVVEEVGHGGMAVVYRGHDTVLEREVAIKVLHAHLADRQESRARLQREALAVAKLRHDNILEIFDYSGGDAAESYIVTEFIHGPTMREWVDEKLDPRPTVAAMIVHRLCLALREAHRVGIVHRDIKPENVMVREGDGALKLMDFGIAQILDDQKLTLTGQLIGSPAYMAPELISGRPLDQRTDLFSLGILLYQLATGKLPFSGRNPHEVLNRIADGDYPSPASICPLVDRDLEAIIAVALATSPDERFQSAESFAKELERYLGEMGVTPTPDELKAYFGAPEDYVRSLDERVAVALMERASEASDQGQTARAIALLSRVLEIDNGHAGARSLLDKVRRRERRLRQVLMGAGGLALTGLVAAGIMLVPKGPPATARAMAAADAPRAGDARGTASDPAANEATPPPHRRATIPVERERTSPAPTDDSGGETKPDPEDADTEGRPRPLGGARGPGRKPKRVNPAVGEPLAFSCKLEITNIPFNTARNHKLQVGRETVSIDARTVELQLERPTTVGLTQGKWRGTARLTAEACGLGTVQLKATPQDALVRITGVPPTTVVKCLAGCATRDINKNQAADKTLHPIPIGSGGSQRVKLALQAEGYQPRDIERIVHPGETSLSVKLEPRK